jgi:hypothetical protein
MDIGKSVSYIFEDDGWPTKLGLGALIMFVPVLNFAAIGYEVKVVRSVMQDEPRPLPTWNDLGGLFMDGLWLALARWVFALPIGLAMCLPLTFFPLLITSQTEREMEQRLPFFFLICGVVFLVVMFLSLILGLISPAMTAQYVRQGTFGACFNLGAMLEFVRNNTAAYFTVWGVTLVAGLVLGAVIGPVGVILNFIPCVGSLAYLGLYGVGLFGVLLVTGHLEGQLLRADLARTSAAGAAPLTN